MSLVDPHLEAHLRQGVGEWASRRRYLDADDIAWIMARKREGVSDQNIAAMGNIALVDVRKVCSDHLPGPAPRRETYDPQRKVATLSTRFRVCDRQGLHLVFRASFGGRVVLTRSMDRATVGSLLVRKSWRDIVRDVANRHGLALADMIGPSRSPKIAIPRQEAMWALKQEGRWSLPQIGRLLGNRDHTTIIHGVRQHEKRLREAANPLKVAA